MSDLPSPQAEAAYRRAVSAYQRGSYEEAQRWATETLAIEPAHVAAAALLRRIGGREAGPRVVSMDPTFLPGGNGGSGMAEPADPTVVVPRRIPRPVPPRRNPAPPGPHQRTAGHRASEPTVIVGPSNARTPSRDGAGSLWQRLRGDGGRRDGFGGATPRGRGILIVAGAIALAAASVWGVIRAIQWLSSDGQRLTIEVAEGGRIVGDGIRCGAGSSRCSTAFSKGDRVELFPEAERDYEFAGFTGDCEATRGILLMDAPKTCGARFERRPTRPSAATYALSIEKPKGGTILYKEVITCGSLGPDCSEDIPAGEVVTLRFQADDGFKFDSFFAECGGEFVMNSARTCGAVFIPSTAVNALPNPKPDPVAPRGGPGPGVKPGPRETKPAVPEEPPPSTPPPGPAVNQPVPPVAPAVGVGSSQPQPLVKPPQPPPPPDTAEEHAKKEIKQRVAEYCNALKTLKPEAVQRVFPNANIQTLKRQFDNYKSLDCTLAPDMEYERFEIGTGATAPGGAQVKVGMKQAIEMRTGGAPKAQETTVTIVLSRIDLTSRWKIDDVIAVPKK